MHAKSSFLFFIFCNLPLHTLGGCQANFTEQLLCATAGIDSFAGENL